jgi:uncharacterized protein (TIGR01777 family)
MQVAITGATGLVGTALAPQLERSGHEVQRVVRRDAGAGDILWRPDTGEVDTAGLEAVDAVVHLAGENIAKGRWNEAKKARIRASRVEATELLCRSLAGLDSPPKTLIAASAIGFYGDRGDELLTEASVPGSDFLGNVCVAWEAATEPAVEAGIRVVRLRIGVVLSPRGGALAKMLLPFKLCGGGIVGNGQQYWSWISLDDLIGVVLHCLQDESLSGPVNAVAPQAITNREFTKTLGRVLARPTVIPLPAFAARIALGEMADALLLSSTRVEPQRLAATGFSFQHPNLESALRHLLEK